MDSYFVYNGIKYIIKYDNNEVNFFKEKDNIIVELNEEDKKIINSIFKNKNGYEYYSERINTIIQNNDKIIEKDYLLNYFNWIEKIIPQDCRDNFYRNLSSLQIDLNFDYIYSEDRENLSNEDYINSGTYSVKNNTILMSKKSIFELMNISKKNPNPEDFFWREYSLEVLHEMLHMSSSKYDSDTGIALCGFDTYPSDDIRKSNRGLTEGMTDCLAMIGVPDTVDIASEYYFEVCFITQLSNIIDGQVLLKSYFGNLGIKEIENELFKFDDSKFKSFKLFRDIENNFLLRKIKNESTNLVGNIQNSLIDCLEKKITLLESNGLSNEIDKILMAYEMGLVTPERLKLMNKNPDDYVGVTDSIERFNEIKNRYLVKESMIK